MATYINPSIARINGKNFLPVLTTKPIQVASITGISVYVPATLSGNVGEPKGVVPSTVNSVITLLDSTSVTPITIYCTQTTAELLTLIAA